MRTWDSRSRPEPKGLLGRRARRATPRSLPKSRVKKLTIKSASRKGYVRRTNVSLTPEAIDSTENNRLTRRPSSPRRSLFSRKKHSRPPVYLPIKEGRYALEDPPSGIATAARRRRE